MWSCSSWMSSTWTTRTTTTAARAEREEEEEGEDEEEPEALRRLDGRMSTCGWNDCRRDNHVSRTERSRAERDNSRALGIAPAERSLACLLTEQPFAVSAVSVRVLLCALCAARIDRLSASLDALCGRRPLEDGSEGSAGRLQGRAEAAEASTHESGHSEGESAERTERTAHCSHGSRTAETAARPTRRAQERAEEAGGWLSYTRTQRRRSADERGRQQQPAQSATAVRGPLARLQLCLRSPACLPG